MNDHNKSLEYVTRALGFLDKWSSNNPHKATCLYNISLALYYLKEYKISYYLCK